MIKFPDAFLQFLLLSGAWWCRHAAPAAWSASVNSSLFPCFCHKNRVWFWFLWFVLLFVCSYENWTQDKQMLSHWAKSTAPKYIILFSSFSGWVFFQEYIPVQTGASTELNPFYLKYSSRTQHAILYMNPHKINLDLILELLVYLGIFLFVLIKHKTLLPTTFFNILYVSCLTLNFFIFFKISDKSPQFRNIEGAALIFLPGLAHIQQLYDLLSNDRRFYSER